MSDATPLVPRGFQPRALHSPRPGETSAPRRQRGLHALLSLLFLIFSSPALAQSPPRTPLDHLKANLAIDWGLADHIPAERFCPITLWLNSGEEACSGVITIEHRQDSTQSVRISTPFATTPGKTTPLEIVTLFPGQCERLSMTIVAQYASGGGGLAMLDFATAPTGGELQLPGIDASERRIAVFGDVPGLTGNLNVKGSQGAWMFTSFARMPSQAMPTSWAAYDAVEGVIIPADLGLSQDSPADPRQIDALMTWVRSGGRLIVVLDAASDAHARFLSGVPLPRVSPLGDVSTPNRLSTVIANARPDDASMNAPFTEKPAPSIRARMIDLDAERTAAGWSGDYIDLSGPTGSLRGVMASAPVGFGLVTLVAFDASRVGSVASDLATRAVWRDILERRIPSLAQPPQTTSNPWMVSSAANRPSQQAIAQSLNGVANLPEPGDGVFIVLVLCAILLALAVGPLDAIVLKKLGQRHRSWATALAWALVASLAAYAAPSAFRSTGSKHFRLCVRDAICELPSEPGTLAPAALSAETGVSALFAGAKAQISRPDSPPGQFVRGVSPTFDYYQFRRRTGALASLALVSSSDAGIRSLPMAPTEQGQWTLRAILDETPAIDDAGSSSLAGSIELTSTARTRGSVRIQGLPPDAKVLQTAIQTASSWLALGTDAETRTSARGELELDVDPGAASPESRWKSLDVDPSQPWSAGNRTFPQDPGLTLSIGHAADRSAAIAARVKGGGYACVYVALASTAPEFTLSDKRHNAWEQSTHHIFRILVPINPGPEPAAPGDKPATAGSSKPSPAP